MIPFCSFYQIIVRTDRLPAGFSSPYLKSKGDLAHSIAAMSATPGQSGLDSARKVMMGLGLVEGRDYALVHRDEVRTHCDWLVYDPEAHGYVLTAQKLKGCPFCGEPARLLPQEYGLSVDCPSCRVLMKIFGTEQQMLVNQAIVNWNKRAETSSDGWASYPYTGNPRTGVTIPSRPIVG